MNPERAAKVFGDGALALHFAALVVRAFESFRAYAYPDVGSDLGKATWRARWGFMPAQQILDQLPPNIVALRGDPWTVGYGATGSTIGPATVWDLPKAEASLQFTLKQFQAGVRRLVTVPMTYYQEAALISFAYNVGLDEDADTIPEGLGDSTLLREFNNGHAAAAAAHFEEWTRSGNSHPPGLLARRKQERALFEGTAAPLTGAK